MPFAGNHNDPFFEDKMDWFVKRPDGEPYVARWEGTSLDMTHPGAAAYVASRARKLAREWGYGYFKMDGLGWARLRNCSTLTTPTAPTIQGMQSSTIRA